MPVRNDVRSQIGMLLFLTFMVLTAGCATGNGNLIGTLQVVGKNAFLNQGTAVSGMKLYRGDYLHTGEDTSVTVRLARGGFVQLDQDTDPVFDYIRNGMYLVVRILSGRVYSESDRLCLQAPQVTSCSYSKVLIRIDEKKTVLTLLSGKAEIELPETRRVKKGEQVIVSGSEIKSVKLLSLPEMDALLEWREKFLVSMDLLKSLTIYFDFDSERIEQVQNDTLVSVARILHANPQANVMVEGHTDATGLGEDYNCHLSLARARGVRERLMVMGIAKERLMIEGKCDGIPVASNRTAAGRRKNRRVEFILLPE